MLLSQQLKVDKVKLIELSGTSESEFSCVRILLLFVNLCIEIETIINQLLSFQVATSMKDLCFDVFGISSVKKDPRDAKGNRGMCLSCFHFLHFLTLLALLVGFLLMIELQQTC